MSLHIEAQKGEIAPLVLLPGDPLRAKHIATHFLEGAKPYNSLRNMLGYTGRYHGQEISVQATGMGMPSMSIYAQELIEFYGVKKLIRVGSCGSMQQSIGLGDLILAMSASTDSAMNIVRFHGMSFAPTADFSLLKKAAELAQNISDKFHVGGVLCSDFFYGPTDNSWKIWADHSILAVEMETAALYTLAQKFSVAALAILSVTDHLPSGLALEPKKRETQLNSMVELALATISNETRQDRKAV